MEDYMRFMHREPTLFRFIGNSTCLDGLKIKPGKEYLCEYKGNRFYKGKTCMVVEIAPKEVSHKRATCLYSDMAAFMENWVSCIV